MCPRCEEERRYWRVREKEHQSKIRSLKSQVAALQRGAPRSPPRPRPSDMPWDVRHLQQQLDFFRNRTVRLTREGADLLSRNEYLARQVDGLTAQLQGRPAPGE